MITEMEKAIKDYQWVADKDPEMLKMYEADRRDLREILRLFKAGKYFKAWNKACQMDTAARDVIPNSIYEFLSIEVDGN